MSRINPALEKALNAHGAGEQFDWYLAALKAFLIRPNFWCSAEFFLRAGWHHVIGGDWCWVEDREHTIVLPPINLFTGKMAKKIDHLVWADFIDFAPVNAEPIPLDLEFIYWPEDFRQMRGGKWRKFRKNSRKFYRRVKGAEYRVLTNSAAQFDREIRRLAEDWLNGLVDDTIHDADVMIDYLLYGTNRGVLVDEKGQLYGVNVWDRNHVFTNYRYALADPDPELFVAEALRSEFYHNQYNWVNDGGSLDRPGLEEFKRSLNPVEVRTVCSWKPKTTEAQ